MSSEGATGRVFLVGAGPGDPGLITVRGRELLEQADVIVHDSLSNEVLLRYAPDAERVFVGKRPDRHPLTQDDINYLLIHEAGKGRRVVRLKGGDPFVFGRGGEEAQALESQARKPGAEVTTAAGSEKESCRQEKVRKDTSWQ